MKLEIVSVQKSEEDSVEYFAADSKMRSMENYPLETLHVKIGDDLILATEFEPKNYRQEENFRMACRFYPEILAFQTL